MATELRTVNISEIFTGKPIVLKKLIKQNFFLVQEEVYVKVVAEAATAILNGVAELGDIIIKEYQDETGNTWFWGYFSEMEILGTYSL